MMSGWTFGGLEWLISARKLLAAVICIMSIGLLQANTKTRDSAKYQSQFFDRPLGPDARMTGATVFRMLLTFLPVVDLLSCLLIRLLRAFSAFSTILSNLLSISTE